MTKIVQLVTTCRGCPNRLYSSGGIYECSVVRAPLAADCVIPDWCPLADYPTPGPQADKGEAYRQWQAHPIYPSAGPMTHFDAGWNARGVPPSDGSKQP